MKTRLEMLSHNKLFSSGIFAVILLCGLGFIIYSNTFYNSFHFDDEPSIVENFSIRSLANLGALWTFWPSRFITHFSVALNYHFNQTNVFGYHFFNLTVHILSAILVWWFVLLTFSTSVMKDQKIAQQANLIAFFAGLVFVSHPIQIQAVTYIIQRTTSLATLFYLTCLSLYVKSRLLQLQSQSSRVKISICYIASLITAVLAMFTKEMTVTLPLMIILYELCFLKTEKGINWKRIIPFLITLFIIPSTMFLTKSVNFSQMRRIAEPIPNISVGHYLLTQFRVIVTYLRLLFIPLNQNLDYDYSISQSLWDLPTFVSFLFLVFILIMAIRIFSIYRLISFAILWFFLTLLPESSVIPIKDVIYEHRLYLPMVGFSFFIVTIVYYFFEKKTPRPMIPLLLIIVTIYSILTYNRNFVWKDELTLWNDVVRKSPKKARPYNNRGFAYQTQGELDRAMSDFNKAIEIDPRFARAYYNRGNFYQDKGQLGQAILEYNKAIEIKPHYAEAYANRGSIYYNKGSLDQALADFNKAIEISPHLAKAHYNRGLIYQIKGNLNQSISDFNKSIEIDPRLAPAYNNRGNVYLAQGNLNQAISDYNKAIEVEPRYAPAYSNRAIAHFYKKEYDKSWNDICKAEALGGKIDPVFIEELKKVSERRKMK